MNKKKFFKILSYSVSILLLVVTAISYMYRLKGESLILKPYLIATGLIIYYFFIQKTTKDNPEFVNAKKAMLVSVILYSLFELVMIWI